MDKSQLLSAFNDHFTDFIEDIRRVFPDNTDIITLHSSIAKVRKMNPKLIIKAFNEHVIGSYSKEIEQGELDFFINKDYKNDLNKMGMLSNMII